ncbi:MAG: PA domain-containing protein [Lysobacteraceae bacterium]
MKRHLLALAIGGGLLLSTAANAANILPLNRDPAGAGLNDPTAAAPVGGNPGKTVGEQRRIVYQFAADLWGAVLKSNVDVRVAASFQPLPCSTDAGVLGAAGPVYVNRDFANAPVAGTWYSAALANAIAGRNLNAGPDYVFPADIDIDSAFNSELGGPGCIEGGGWYYGLDGKTPAGKLNFLNVVAHEIGHGLGFLGFVDPDTGELANFDGTPRPDAYTQLAYDNVTGQRFGAAGMTDALRAVAIRTPGRTVWDGSRVRQEARLVLDEKLLLKARGGVSANDDFGTASFGPAATAANFSGTVALADDGVGPDPADAGQPRPAGSLAGKIAFIDRGTCSFESKVVNAQNAGAVAAIIGNVATSAPGLITMSDDPTVVATIPAVQIVAADADAIRAALPNVRVALGTVPGRVVGADASGRVQLFTPSVVQPGSTYSHFDVTLTPNALMEPGLTDTLNAQFNLDLTPALFRDTGWGVHTGGAKIGRWPTIVPALQPGGLVIGANVSAQRNVCLFGNDRQPLRYLQCMLEYSATLRTGKVLTLQESLSVNSAALSDTIDQIYRLYNLPIPRQ